MDAYETYLRNEIAACAKTFGEIGERINKATSAADIVTAMDAADKQEHETTERLEKVYTALTIYKEWKKKS